MFGSISLVAKKVTSTSVLLTDALNGENLTVNPDGVFNDEKIAVSVNDDDVS